MPAYPLDDETNEAIQRAIMSDNTAAMLGGDRATQLQQMYPENQPLPGADGDYGDEMMVSLPGQPLGSELRVRPGESEVVAESPPFAGPPPRRPLDVGQAPSPAPAPQQATPQERGFDWQRAFTAFGGGDVGALDRKRQMEAEGPMRQRMHQQELDMRQADLNDRMDERHTKSQELRDSMDPNSEASRTAAEDYARSNLMRAELVSNRNPKLAEMLKGEAQRAQGKSRAQIAQMAKTNAEIMGTFGQLLDREAKEKMAQFRQDDATADNARADRALQMRGARGHGKGAEVKVKMPDAKTVEHYNTRTVALREIDDMLRLLPKVTYTGYGAETANQVASKLPNALDPRTDSDREFVSLLGKLRAKERKEIYGAALSKFDIADAATWLANLGTNKATIAQNLKTLQKALAQTQEETAKNYPKLSGDTISDAPPKSPAGGGVQDAQEGARAFSKKANKYFVRKGGKWVPE